LDDFLGCVARVLKRGPLAFGFESPQFVPVRANLKDLTRGREGESTYPWSGAVGAMVLTQGIALGAYTLRRLRGLLDTPAPAPFLAWDDFAKQRSGLFLWEAFVTKEAKPGDPYGHHADARVAANEFKRRVGTKWRPPASDLEGYGSSGSCSIPYFSVLGASLLWSGWSTNHELLRSPVLVVRAPHLGPPE